jgi:hypothetical protein
MTLAFILFVGLSFGSPLSSQATTTAQQAESQPATNDKPASASQTQMDQGNPATPNTSGTTKPSASANSAKSSTPSHAPAKKVHKSTASANCPSASPSKSVSSKRGATAAQTKTSSAKDSPGAKPVSATASDCPPKKVIVPQGGAAAPDIELVGGAAGSQASNERKSASEMLQSTEVNLKQIEGTPLNSSQQDMIKQVRQFMAQSKTAADSGDPDGARTLAWKAQSLSEQLLKTQK